MNDDFRMLASGAAPLSWLEATDGAALWFGPDFHGRLGLAQDVLEVQGWLGAMHPEDRPRLAHAAQEARARRVRWSGEGRLLTPDGATEVVRIDYAPHGAPDLPRWAGWMSIIEDKIARDRALAIRERRFRSLVTAVAEIVWTTRTDGSMRGDQTAWVQFTGQTPEELVDEGWLQAIHPDDRELTAEAWRTAFVQRTPYRVEHRLRRRDGEYRYMQVSAAPVFDEAGELVEWVGIHADITDRKRIEIELAEARDAAERANIAKSQFIANMSHELRTPLSAVIGYSEMLEEEVEEAGLSHMLRDLRKINDAARHLLRLISDVLDLSKIEANRMTAFAEDFALPTLVAEVASTVQALMARKNNTLRVDMAEDCGLMHTDQVKIRQCLFNLLGNAAKFTESGEITLGVRRFTEGPQDWVKFTVKDTGIGMSEAEVRKLFQRFVQADESTTRRFGGTGLGLSITRGFVQLLGGSVSVHSAPQQGSTFTIVLPARMPVTALADEASELREDETVAPGDVVLVIDDDAATRELLTRFLLREGFMVRTASDGRAGLALARALKPRVVLLDVMMPLMDGWSVLSAIRNDATLRTTPVVMISFVHEEGLAASLGANDYLVKPIEWTQLQAIMAPYHEGASTSVLVVEDDTDSRERVVGMLRRLGIVAREASNGVEGLASVEAQMPAVILLDLMMPEMDGFEFLRELRAQPRWNGIRVVVFSAMDMSSDLRRRLDGKVDRVITKGTTSLRELAEQLRIMRPMNRTEGVSG